MSKKTLLTNSFGECILGEYDLFHYSIRDIHQKYPGLPQNNSDVYQIKFDWSWNGYDGYGEMDFYKSTSQLCNQFGENFSSLTVSSKSKRQQPNGRSNCALYNDASLEGLFNQVLSKINLSNTLTHDEWITKITKK